MLKVIPKVRSALGNVTPKDREGSALTRFINSSLGYSLAYTTLFSKQEPSLHLGEGRGEGKLYTHPTQDNLAMDSVL